MSDDLPIPPPEFRNMGKRKFKQMILQLCLHDIALSVNAKPCMGVQTRTTYGIAKIVGDVGASMVLPS